MYMAGEYPVAFEATLEMLRSKSDYIEPRQVADLRLLLARFTGNRGRSAGAASAWPAHF